MGSGHKYGSSIKPSQRLEQPPIPATTGPRLVSVSFRYVEVGGRYCLSRCDREGVRIFKSCLKKLTSQNWFDVQQTGGKGGTKVGLGYTLYSDSSLHRVVRPTGLSRELRIAGIRASGKARIFGVRENDVYHILWFDPDHEIVPD